MALRRGFLLSTVKEEEKKKESEDEEESEEESEEDEEEKTNSVKPLEIEEEQKYFINPTTGFVMTRKNGILVIVGKKKDGVTIPLDQRETLVVRTLGLRYVPDQTKA